MSMPANTGAIRHSFRIHDGRFDPMGGPFRGFTKSSGAAAPARRPARPLPAGWTKEDDAIHERLLLAMRRSIGRTVPHPKYPWGAEAKHHSRSTQTDDYSSASIVVSDSEDSESDIDFICYSADEAEDGGGRDSKTSPARSDVSFASSSSATSRVSVVHAGAMPVLVTPSGSVTATNVLSIIQAASRDEKVISVL
jgi:hypothetical protein